MNLREAMQNTRLYLDGAMGTLLQSMGMIPGELPERWNITHADVIRSIHRGYYESGANIVVTNTFGANTLKYSAEELRSVVFAAVENVRKAAEISETDHPKFVALDIGPLGKLLKPYGDLEFEQAIEIFAQTVRFGVEAGVDLIFIETMSDSYETKAAVLAAKENSDLPVFVANAYGEDGKLLTGATPAAMAAMLEGLGVDAIGVNCSLGPKQLLAVAQELVRVCSVPVFSKPNAGLPVEEAGHMVFKTGAEEFSDDMLEMAKSGVRMLGGCCGTTPEHICMTVEKTKNYPLAPVTEKKHTVVSSYTHVVEIGDKPVLIGERINPTGKKRFKQALLDGDMDYILREGLTQQDKGAHILDVNVGLPGIDEPAMLTDTVCALQAVTDLPLQLDTSDPVAMECALRLVNGKPMLNSVNGKEEVMRAVFPLMQKYGGVVVALLLDENGIPQTAEGRVEIAKKILETAKEYGVKPWDIIFDPLCMTVSADPNSARVTLKALRILREEMGARTVLGVSNISFGLPQREIVNASFFSLALENGLSAAIVNPNSVEMLKAYRAFMLLNGMDENCEQYIAFAETVPAAQGTAAAPVKAAAGAQEEVSDLKHAIIRGLKDRARDMAKQLLAEQKPLEVVDGEIIPALDVVGKGFEEKKVYLPQLLMSAEAAKYAFEEVKKVILASGGTQEKKGMCVLATVKGDIHDIGKNIVKVLLENYGYQVIDMGKDVPVEDVVRAVVEKHVPLCGLSALMTTTVPSMEKTIATLREEAPWCKVVVGGAVLNEDYARRIGADKYARDAMETVRYAEELFAKA